MENDSYSELIQNAVNDAKYLYPPVHSYKAVDANDYKYLDSKFYDQTLKKLEAKGFSSLGDVEISTLKSKTFKDTFLRCTLSQDKQVIGNAFQCKLRFRYLWLKLVMPKQCLKVVEFATVLSNGYFLDTTNFSQQLGQRQPEEFIRTYVESEDPQEIYKVHKTKLTEYLAQNNDVKAKPIFDIEAMYDVWNLRTHIQHEFKKEMGWVVREDLEKYKPAYMSTEELDELYEAVVQPQTM